MKIAVIGSGISGLSCAYELSKAGHEISLFEANDYFGGHTHTVDVSLEGQTYGVDTGFLVFNHKTYPNLVRLFKELDIATVATDMSFSVKMPAGKNGSRSLEWAGANLDTVFAQRSNLLRPAFLRMLRDILRFNKQTTALASTQEHKDFQQPLGSFLDQHGYSKEFRQWYLLPMAACIWSCPTETMMAFPLSSFVNFCHNHGLLQVNDRPQWQTVKGGARQYVEKILPAIAHKHLQTPVLSVREKAPGAIVVHSEQGSQTFEHVVFASHSDQSLKLLVDADLAERQILSSVKYQPNRAVLHTDASVLPQNKKAWSAWNYQSESGNEPRVCVHYLINQLQPLPFKTPVIVTLNPIEEPASASIINSFDYSHPVFDAMAINAQHQLANIQGRRNIWFAGAWTGYGFHEDGLKSGLRVAESILARAEAAYEDMIRAA
ncbi:NAD(P)/FAD-dependent oxidoreductase [Undibacterium pigrum]|uniref:Putative NAD/FAD-binding protein n=1 Tax=Undibacterium pigrum TaxID=401470 RepID=A0A318J2M8_9BURK|nr:FAD-dependent oxidoreductase [Undibacterium pigrum]PXX41970.1 putative NAD/FAD-binding protein [Undibacterium pigrum]